MLINPSNPCGAVFSKQHMLEILQVASKHKLPLLSDEMYYGMSFGEGQEFTSFGNLSSEVPVICVSSLSKVFCVPGWRLGWIIVYNNNNYFDSTSTD
jgi:tyrosine aminotransferase